MNESEIKLIRLFARQSLGGEGGREGAAGRLRGKRLPFTPMSLPTLMREWLAG